MMFPIFRRDSRGPYQIITASDEKLSEESAFLSDQAIVEASPRRVWPFVLPWIFTTSVFAYLALYFYLSSRVPSYGSFESGWATDFKPAHSSIQREVVTFTGGPAFMPNGTYWVPNPDPVDYVGIPSPEVDQAWEDLTWGRYILITEDEAKQAFSENYGNVSEFWSPMRGGYVGGFDMFHTLHCLNRLRKALEPDYYQESDHINHRIHRGHCIEQIRQYIMCSGDMTIIPTRYNNLRHRNYVESDVPHTCRNFGMLRNYLSERYNGSLAVPPVCPKGTFAEQGSNSCKDPDW